jgi:hypothetical protein
LSARNLLRKFEHSRLASLSLALAWIAPTVAASGDRDGDEASQLARSGACSCSRRLLKRRVSLSCEPRFVARNKHNLIVRARNTDEFSVMLRGSCQMRRPFSNASLPVTQARPLSAFRDSAGSSGVLHADSARRRAMRKTPSKRSSSTFGRARPALIVPSRVRQRSLR